jgi:squalene-hopene/tetraprenyl-beta-curcumene cyclase
VVERLNGVDGLGAIYPAMANSVMMFDTLGYAPIIRTAPSRESVERLLVVKDEEAYCQPCVSPVWDTALAAHAMLEVGGEAAVAQADKRAGLAGRAAGEPCGGRLGRAAPDVAPGGWAFQYNNDHYPDLDDTAVVVMAMDRARRPRREGCRGDHARRGVDAGLQSHDGGFGALMPITTSTISTTCPLPIMAPCWTRPPPT